MPSLFGANVAGAPCIECRKGLLGSSLRCSECNEGVHLTCSGLPLMSLVRLATTRATFACSSCIKGKAGDRYSDVLEEIKKSLEEEKLHNKSPNVLSQPGDHSSGKTADDSAEDLERDASESWAGVDCSQREAKEMPGVSAGVADQGKREGDKDSVRLSVVEKTRLCRYYKAGSCKFGWRGEGCKFEHPKKCFKYIRFGGNTPKGCRDNKCPYFHPPLCRLVEAGKTCGRDRCRYFHRRAAQAKNTRQRTDARAASQKENRKMRSYAEVAAPVRGAPRLPIDEELPGRERIPNISRGATLSGAQLDFQLLQEQMARMERQLRHLMDGGGGSSRSQRCSCLRET